MSTFFLQKLDAHRVAKVGWALTAVSVCSWYVYDTGMWAQMSPFWKALAVVFGALELWLLCNDYSFSEDLWAYLPERHIIGLAFGMLGIHLFGTPDPSHFWYLLMGHFFFTPKRMSTEELFRAALARYAETVALLEKYRDLSPNPLPPAAPAPGNVTITVNNVPGGQ